MARSSLFLLAVMLVFTPVPAAKHGGRGRAKRRGLSGDHAVGGVEGTSCTVDENCGAGLQCVCSSATRRLLEEVVEYGRQLFGAVGSSHAANRQAAACTCQIAVAINDVTVTTGATVASLVHADRSCTGSLHAAATVSASERTAIVTSSVPMPCVQTGDQFLLYSNASGSFGFGTVSAVDPGANVFTVLTAAALGASVAQQLNSVTLVARFGALTVPSGVTLSGGDAGAVAAIMATSLALEGSISVASLGYAGGVAGGGGAGCHTGSLVSGGGCGGGGTAGHTGRAASGPLQSEVGVGGCAGAEDGYNRGGDSGYSNGGDGWNGGGGGGAGYGYTNGEGGSGGCTTGSVCGGDGGDKTSNQGQTGDGGSGAGAGGGGGGGDRDAAGGGGGGRAFDALPNLSNQSAVFAGCGASAGGGGGGGGGGGDYMTPKGGSGGANSGVGGERGSDTGANTATSGAGGGIGGAGGGLLFLSVSGTVSGSGEIDARGGTGGTGGAGGVGTSQCNGGGGGGGGGGARGASGGTVVYSGPALDSIVVHKEGGAGGAGGQGGGTLCSAGSGGSGNAGAVGYEGTLVDMTSA